MAEIIDNKDVAGTDGKPDGQYVISPEEIETARWCIDRATALGAAQARVSFCKSTLDTNAFLNGEIDKVTHCADRSVDIQLFVDGRYGSYSTNRVDRAQLESFIRRAIDNTRMLAPDPCRCLPAPEICARNARTGRELGLCDDSYNTLTAPDKLALATSGAIFSTLQDNKEYKIISEECEYSDSIDDGYMIDSQGFEGRHTETSFSFCTEISIQDSKGHKYSGYDWDASPFLRDLNIPVCGPTALQKAVDRISPKSVKSGKYTMVVENTSASRLVSPLLKALNGSAIQQKNSFLTDSLGKRLFPEALRIVDLATTPGKSGSRLFDDEGIATSQRDIISGGQVQMYFVNTYISKKLAIPPTVGGPSRPTVMPLLKNDLECTEIDINLRAILERCGEGILVTGFNGGNYNHTTGNFSYGVEGFAFKNGKILHPVKEALITGNMLELWGNLLAAGSDAKPGSRWQVPTLVFGSVDFSA